MGKRSWFGATRSVVSGHLRTPHALAPCTATSLGVFVSFLSSLALSALAPSPAHAGGFYLLDRGTRPMGRGGAFVAGTDDPHALWYNPAGLGMGGEEFVLDATMTFLHVDYTRVDSGGNTLPTVGGNSAPLPIPTIAGSFDLGLENFTFGVGVFAPNAALMQWPETVTGPDGSPMAAPQRYSLLSMDGSIIASLALGAAWTPIPELSIGVGVHVVYGAFAARTGLSACDGTICTFPEDPDYDGVAQLTLNPAFSAIANIGVIYDAGPVRLGASVMTPFELSGRSSIEVRTPAAAMFDGAFVRTREGECAGVTDDEIAMAIAAGEDHPCTHTSADLDLDFPMVIRFGVQLDAVENLALELAVVWETWSFQRQAAVSPRSVWIADALGGALDYEVGALNIPRNMNDTVSVRLGGEYTIDGLVQVRLGAYYENGAFSDTWLNALTVDSDKIVVSGGASVRVHEGLWLDAMVGYAHLFPRNVSVSEVPQPNPIRPAPAEPVFIGNGSYTMTAPFFGVGLRWNADWAAPGSTEVAPVEEPVALPEPEPVPEPVIEPAPEPEPEVAPPIAEEPEEPEETPRERRRRERRRRPR